MVGKKVWVVFFHHPDFGDLNGVFSTREKARNYILDNVKRCYWWKDFKTDDAGETWEVFKFICVERTGSFPTSVEMCEQIIE